MLHPQVLAQEWRFLLQVERPDAEDKGCERGSARKAMDETNKEVAGARSVSTESVFSCYLEHHHRRPSLPVLRAASGRRSSISPASVVR